MATQGSSRPRGNPQVRRRQGEGRLQRHRRRAARQVPAQGQVRGRRRQRLRLLRRGVRLGLRRRHLRQHPSDRLAARLPGRAGPAGPEHPSQGALGRRRRFLPGRIHQRRRQPVPGLPAPDLEAGAEARREARLPGDDRHGVRVVQLPRNAAELGGQEGRGAGNADAGHVRLLAAAREPEPRVLQRAHGRDAGLRRADRGAAHRDRPRRLRSRHRFQRSAGAGRPRHPVQDRRQGDRLALRHHAQLHGQVEPAVPGLQRPHPPEPVGWQGQPVLRRQEPAQDEQAVRELSGRPGGIA